MNLPQLRMIRNHLDNLSALVVPDGCDIVRVRDAEGLDAWAAVLNDNGELGTWDVSRAEMAISEGNVWKESIHLLTRNGVPLATACVQLHGDEPDIVELGWVAVSPLERGRGLGKTISLALLHFMKQEGFSRCFLLTDDERLPAIKLYLDLGFKPDFTHESHASRWEEILKDIGAA